MRKTNQDTIYFFLTKETNAIRERLENTFQGILVSVIFYLHKRLNLSR